jgi:hypothetical protein
MCSHTQKRTIVANFNFSNRQPGDSGQRLRVCDSPRELRGKRIHSISKGLTRVVTRWEASMRKYRFVASYFVDFIRIYGFLRVFFLLWLYARFYIFQHRRPPIKRTYSSGSCKCEYC